MFESNIERTRAKQEMGETVFTFLLGINYEISPLLPILSKAEVGISPFTISITSVDDVLYQEVESIIESVLSLLKKHHRITFKETRASSSEEKELIRARKTKNRKHYEID